MLYDIIGNYYWYNKYLLLFYANNIIMNTNMCSIKKEEIITGKMAYVIKDDGYL